MSTFEEKLENYAQLTISKGINVKKGQTLVIFATVDSVSFVRKLTKAAYQAGARHVYYQWEDDDIKLSKYKLAPKEAFNEYPMWEAEGLEEIAKNDGAFLYIRTPNADLLKNIDSDRIAAANKTEAQALEEYKDYRMKGSVSWSIICVPTETWAKKVFPDTDPQQAVDKLWDTVFSITRADRKDPIKEWEDHKKQLANKVQFLNDKNYKKLHYRGPGTDLTIEFPEGYIWKGGSWSTPDGHEFIPNIPTEEVFTLPLKTGVNGTVTSTKPLNYSGNLIERFSLTFKDGKIVDFQAEEGEEILKNLIETDEGSHFLGEVALVPHHSPISDSGLIFFNTLYDENASCHLAIGKAYPSCVKGGSEMTGEELEKRGVNKSLTHVDFMMGSAELDIDGETQDGSVEPVFRKGNWA